MYFTTKNLFRKCNHRVFEKHYDQYIITSDTEQVTSPYILAHTVVEDIACFLYDKNVTITRCNWPINTLRACRTVLNVVWTNIV